MWDNIVKTEWPWVGYVSPFASLLCNRPSVKKSLAYLLPFSSNSKRYIQAMLILRFQSSEAFYCCVVKKHDTYRCMNLEMSSFVDPCLEGLIQIGDSPPQFLRQKVFYPPKSLRFSTLFRFESLFSVRGVCQNIWMGRPILETCLECSVPVCPVLYIYILLAHNHTM